MSETAAHTDDEDDVSQKAQIAAERIRRATNGDCDIYKTPSGDERIILGWSHTAIDGVCDLSKAAIINDVMQSPAAVELYSTRDGSEAVEFELID